MALKLTTINFNAIRKTLCNEVTKVTGVECILEEAQYQNAQRPKLPYFALKINGPATKNGDDNYEYISATKFNLGGQRKMTVGFDCYGNDQEEAYNLMSLWQTALELRTIQEDLRRDSIAVWIIGNVADLSQLLNTGYEGRAHLDVQFGIAFNMTVDLGEIDKAHIEGTVDTGSEIIVDDFNAPPP